MLKLGGASIMKSAVILGLMFITGSQAWAIVTPPKSQEASLGLQSARRVVRTELRRESRGFGWSQFVVTKHKRDLANKTATSPSN